MSNYDGGLRPPTPAGRRSAGLGGKGGARTHTHAVGVRAVSPRVSHVSARRSQLRPRSCRGVRDGAIWAFVVHRWFLTGQTYIKFPNFMSVR